MPQVLSLEAHRPSHHMDTQPDEEAEPIVAEPEPIVAVDSADLTTAADCVCLSGSRVKDCGLPVHHL